MKRLGRRLWNSRIMWWLRNVLPWCEDPAAVTEGPAVPLEELFWNMDAGPSTWRNPDCLHRGKAAACPHHGLGTAVGRVNLYRGMPGMHTRAPEPVVRISLTLFEGHGPEALQAHLFCEGATAASAVSAA
ncbi:hypothetical protein [Streptomyces sp. NPDC008121]|uniref:hypothetical protein n=1 Tax=Streptomyces sp. NPDC008121 TaxID=3364809 RepID=UPI0036E377F0